MVWLAENLPFSVFVVLVSLATGAVTALGTRRSLRDCELPAGWAPLQYGLLAMALAAGFTVCVLHWNTQSTPEVRPEANSRIWQLAYHLSLVSLLLIVTATDLRGYYIVEWNCWLGLTIGVLGATLSGDFQLAHVWIDWNWEVPQIREPWFPPWIARYPRLHGFAWSVTGAATGYLITAGLRRISAWVLQRPSMGSGDVLLMAMIGSYLGWQPTVVSLLLAPMLGLCVGGFLRLQGSQAPLPFGPFLALASLLVLTGWRFFWMAEIPFSPMGPEDRATTFAVRRFFGDPLALLIVSGVAVGLLIGLLGLLRAYHSLPIGRQAESSTESNDTPQT